MRLRKYQLDSENKTFALWESGFRSVIGQMATGLGKTIIFSSIIRRIGGRAMILAHRKELIFQAKEKLEKVTGIIADVEMGEYKASQNGNLFHPKADVICSTIQTHATGGDGGGRMTKFDPMDFSVLIIDECHRSVAATYRKVIDYYMTNPKLVVLGVTASSDRSDRESLGQIFEEVAFDYDIRFGIDQGWLVPVPTRDVNVSSMDISMVGTSAGELNSSELRAVLESEKPIQEMIQAIFEIVHGLEPMALYSLPTGQWAERVKGIKPKRAIAFTRFVHHARMLSEILNRILFGISSWVCGKTEDNERDKIIGNFRENTGATVLCNVGVLTEGYDDSGVEIIFMCAPLKSRIRYAQQAGRGTRPHDSIASKLNDLPAAALRRAMIANSCKPHCTIIDFVGNSGKHKLISMVDILAGDVSDEIIQSAKEIIRKSGKPMRVEKVIEDEEKRLEEKQKKEIEESARKAAIVAKTQYSVKSVDPFNILDIKPSQPRSWDNGKPITPGMAKVLRQMKLNPEDFTYSQARQLVSAQCDRWDKGLCSLGQAKLLKKFSYPTDVTFEKASEIITAIKNNNWKRVEIPTSKVKIPPKPVTTITDSNCPF